MSHILVISTGGTIASLPQDNGDVKAVLQGEDLVRRLPVQNQQDQNQGKHRPIIVKTFTTIGSFAFTFETLYELGNVVQTAIADEEVGGIVITHGTDTMEETAFFLSLTCQRKKPIVLTGAQLNASEPASDGLRNLSDAIRVASCQEAAALGPVIAFAGFLHAGREVRKVDTSALEAFQSVGFGPVGRVEHNKVIIRRKCTDYPLLPLQPMERVGLVRLGIGMTGDEILKIAEGYKGLVIEAYGLGNAHPSIAPAVQQLANRKIPVVITSRCLRGSVAPVYGGGGGRDLERAGAFFAGDLSGEKARILLALLIGNKLDHEAFYEWFNAWGH
ncbi:asparaginase [Fodinisporobacter ferrooxydans]|uniref:asparaginase n=1 Tax=Fodinisporobacter ferrooxydans TaxID=2901836 RepID=A0ABY4CJ01_9BACL|nr:asparaginase [Alicyclobacillaceae bacterium MYW30-H2]